MFCQSWLQNKKTYNFNFLFLCYVYRGLKGFMNMSFWSCLTNVQKSKIFANERAKHILSNTWNPWFYCRFCDLGPIFGQTGPALSNSNALLGGNFGPNKKKHPPKPLADTLPALRPPPPPHSLSWETPRLLGLSLKNRTPPPPLPGASDSPSPPRAERKNEKDPKRPPSWSLGPLLNALRTLGVLYLSFPPPAFLARSAGSPDLPTHDLSHAKTQFSERLPELVRSQIFTPDSRSVLFFLFLKIASPCAPAEARRWIFWRFLGGKFGVNFADSFDPQNFRLKHFGENFGAFFRRKIRASKKIIRANFVLQTCHPKKLGVASHTQEFPSRDGFSKNFGGNRWCSAISPKEANFFMEIALLPWRPKVHHLVSPGCLPPATSDLSHATNWKWQFSTDSLQNSHFIFLQSHQRV